jgi:hypothetical protein
LSFVVVNDAKKYHYDTNSFSDLKIGTVLFANNDVDYRNVPKDSDKYYLTVSVSETEVVFITDILPLDIDDTFEDDMIIDYPPDIYKRLINKDIGLPLVIGDVSEMWVPDYYCEVLVSQERNKLIDFYPDLEKKYNYVTASADYFWYEFPFNDIQDGRSMFYNAGIKLGYNAHFAILNIKITNYGYAVDCLESKFDNGRFIFPASEFWDNNPEDEIPITFLLYHDGDYLDLYVNGNDLPLGTLVKVKREFIKQYQSLIQTNTCDLTNVIWPRRGDKQIESGKPYRTVEILKLRVTEERTSEIITEIPENTTVLVLETGAEDTIDSIKANWVKVRLADGTEGWCFGGYLLADIPVEPAAIRQRNADLDTSEQEEDTAAVKQQPTGIPLVIILVIAGIVVIGGITVFVVLRKKK